MRRPALVAMNEADHITKALQSKLMREKVEGLNRIISSMARGENVSSFFTNVVNTLVAPSLEVR